MVLRIIALAAVALAAAAPAQAITFSFSSGNLAASADFSLNSSYLQVTLTNTSTFDVGVPADVLTAVFFDVSGSPDLTPVSAKLAPGSSVLWDSPPPNGNVGGEWAYESDLHHTPGHADQGISSTGLNLFGKKDRFPGPNLAGPKAPDGLQYGLLSAGDDPTKGNSKVTGSEPLAKNSVIFLLDSLPVGFNPDASISNVWFQYGTDLCSEPSFPGNVDPHPVTVMPEPITALGLLMGVAGWAGYVRRRRRAR